MIYEGIHYKSYSDLINVQTAGCTPEHGRINAAFVLI